MFKSLYWRLAIALLFVFIIMGVLVFTFLNYVSNSTRDELSQRLHKDFAVNVQMNLDVLKDGAIDPIKIKDVFRTMMVIGPALELYIVDTKGNVVAYQADDSKIKRLKVDLEPIQAFINESKSYPIYGDDPRSKNKKKVFSAALVYGKGNQIINQLDVNEAEVKTIGYLYAIIGGENYDSIESSLESNNYWKIRAAWLVIAGLFLLLSSLLLFYALTLPLRKLTKEIKAFEDSDFKKKPSNNILQIKQQGEVNQLKKSFYQMEQRIFDLLEKLNKQDELRREFLTFLSHDLRTPLSSVKAYIETLESKNDTLSIDERSDFLKKASLNSERLEGMISELFELTRLDGNQIEVNLDEFGIEDLLSDLSNSLENIAKSKGIKLSILRNQNNTHVFGDIEKIERVIQNLIENAVRYSDENASVILDVREVNNDKLMVKVIDFGSGIDEKYLPFIFKPFYQSADRKIKTHQGVGLGLAICYRLLELQNIELHVQSKLNDGTVFSFELNITDTDVDN